jgi:hypothetical protein
MKPGISGALNTPIKPGIGGALNTPIKPGLDLGIFNFLDLGGVLYAAQGMGQVLYPLDRAPLLSIAFGLRSD